METFYAGVSEGLSLDEALRNAKLSYLSTGDPVTANPLYWAGFVTLGSVRPLLIKTWPNYHIVFPLAVIASLVAVFLFFHWMVAKRAGASRVKE